MIRRVANPMQRTSKSTETAGQSSLHLRIYVSLSLEFQSGGTSPRRYHCPCYTPARCPFSLSCSLPSSLIVHTIIIDMHYT
jgi:hypothetical protein